MPIKKLKARQILDTRGDPTVEVDLITDIGLLRSSVPSIVYPNEIAAKEIRDGNEAYCGRTVFKVVQSINNVIAPEILKSKLDVHQQREIDSLLLTLDGTPDKSKLGVNALLGVSVVICKAAAAKRGLPLYRYIATLTEVDKIVLPVPHFNIITGGRSAGNNLIYREFSILPVGAASFKEAMRLGIDIYKEIEIKTAEILEKKPPLLVGDKGSFIPEFEDDNEIISTIVESIESTGNSSKIKIALDIGASSFYREGKYDLEYKTDDSDPENFLDLEAMQEKYGELFAEFPNIVSIEDPYYHEDWEAWSTLLDQQPQLQVVADELTATILDRIRQAIEKNAANCVVIRLNQCGTITTAIECIKTVRSNGWGIIIAVGEGETEDTFIADFTVGVSAGQFKTGAPCRNECVAKYNQILRIEEELGNEAIYAGQKFRNPLT